MDLTTVKSEEVLSPGRRRLSMVEGDINSEAPKCIKRRRRYPSSSNLLTCNIDQQGEQQQQQQEQQQQLLPQVVDQSAPTTPTTTTTSTVKRSSRFRGVSRHRWTGRFEAHLWDKGTWNATQRKKGKQVYLGAYDEEESAARAYDLAAIKYWGTTTFTNFPASDYEKEVEIMQNVTREEYLAFLRRKSSGFSRGVSKYRGVAKHHHNGRWEARIGRVFGNKYLYLGTYGTQEEAAHAYDIAAIEYRGINAVTNFDLSTYIRWLRSPGGLNSLASQESPRPSIETSSFPKQTYADDRIASEQPELPFSGINPFKVDDLGTPQRQEIFQKKIPISPSPITNNNNSMSSSSPTALGLLFRSSIFRELLEKNPNANNEDTTEGTDTKNKSQMENENGFGRVIYDGVGDAPYASSSSSDALPALQSHNELQEGAASPSYNGAGQSFWNGAFNMPPLSPSLH